MNSLYSTFLQVVLHAYRLFLEMFPPYAKVIDNPCPPKFNQCPQIIFIQVYISSFFSFSCLSLFFKAYAKWPYLSCTQSRLPEIVWWWLEFIVDTNRLVGIAKPQNGGETKRFSATERVLEQPQWTEESITSELCL